MNVILKIFIIGIFTKSVTLTIASSNSDNKKLVNTLDSRDNNSGEILHENFSGGKFKHDNDLLEVPEDFFRHPSRSKSDHVHFDDNTFTTLPETLFKVLNNLKNVSICNDRLTILPEGLFQGLPNLILIKFELNNLTTIPRKLFDDQTNLLYLTIKHNHLNNLEEGVFEHTYALKELDLSYNQLVNISGSIFKSLKRLIKLHLNNNYLLHIENKAFSCLQTMEWINLYNNSLTFQIETISPFNSCDSLKTILLGNNSITAIFPDWTTLRKLEKLDLSFNKITKFGNGNIPEHLSFLDLSNNKLTEIGLDVLVKLNETKNFYGLYLRGNPWKCDCENSKSISFMHTFRKVKDLNEIQCAISEAFCSTKIFLAVVISVSAIGFGILVGIILVVYYQQEIKVWLYAHNVCLCCVTEAVVDRHKTYDAFISYSHIDEEFVVDELLPELENGTHPFKLCVHFRDWLGGQLIPEQIARSVNDSRRTIIILSQSFLQSIWGRMEFRTAHQRSLQEGRARVIVVIYGDIGNIENLDDELKAYLKTNTYLRWGEQYFWNKLRYAMPHVTASNKGSVVAEAMV